MLSSVKTASEASTLFIFISPICRSIFLLPIFNRIFDLFPFLIIFFKQTLDFLWVPKEMTLIFLFFAFLSKKLKNLSSLFKIIVPLGSILSIISDLAFAIPLIFLKFSI